VSRTPAPGALRLGSLAVVVLGAVLVLGSASQPRVALDGGTVSTGTADVPGGRALALAALAGVAVALLVRGWARSAVGVLVGGVGVTLTVLNLMARDDEVGFTAFVPDAAKATVQNHLSAWFWLTATGAALLVVGGALIAVRGQRWPASRRDYDAPAAPATSHDTWTALDRGEDPTL